MQPGKPEKNRQKLEEAIARLRNKGNRLQTLLFFFSGHHKSGCFILGEEGDSITTTELESLLKTLSQYVKTFVVFLDCCEGETLKSLENDGCILVQLNACQENERTLVRTKEGSIFTKYLIQALTKQACNDRHTIAQRNPPCEIMDNFITIPCLYKYLKAHMATSGVTPYYTISKGTLENELVAYNYKFNGNFEFTWMAPLTTPVTVSICPTECKDVNELKHRLFQALLCKL